MKRSLRWQFLIPLLIFFALTFTGLYLYLSSTYLTIYQSHLKDTLSSEASLFIKELQGEPGYPVGIGNLQVTTDKYAAALKDRVTVIEPTGVVLSDSEVNAATMENHLTRPEVQQALTGAVGYQVRFSATLKVKMLYVAVPVLENGKVVLIVRFARSLASIESDVSGLNRIILISGIVSLALLLLITYLIFQRTTGPLARLTEAAIEFSTGKIKKVRVRRNGNEIDTLATAFNNMTTQISEQIAELQDQRGKLSNILDEMQDGVIIVDSEGRIQAVNPAAEKMFSVHKEDVVRQPLIQAVQYYQVTELFEKTLKRGQQSTTSIDLPQRSLFLQGIGSILQEPEGESVLLLFQDTTRQRQLEAMRKDFVSNVSHELRTPLASLRALSETLQSGAIEDTPAAHHFVELMEIEIAKLSQMVDELLELSRIESGRVPLKLSANKPLEMIDETVSRMSLQAERAGVLLTTDYAPDLPPVWTDREQIEQVLINLIHNAIKFTPPQGKITVAARLTGKEVIFEVRDTGVGIEKEDLPRIFERFYKSDRARATKGTGLGLSIAKHVIGNHGGRIWVESTPGEGSIFFFSLPIAAGRS